MVKPNIENHAFDWRMYSDATLAGLSALIPLPLLDLVVEGYFRRRMPWAIARIRGGEQDRVAMRQLGRRRTGPLSLAGCLAAPLWLARYLLRRIWRKIIYVFAVADATEQVSEYWHRAYLIDHMIRAGHLEPAVDTEHALQVFYLVLVETDTSPLRGIAHQVVVSSGRIFRLVFRFRREPTAETMSSLGEILGSNWDAMERSLRSVAERYNERYATWPDGLAGAAPGGTIADHGL
jgi:hypothetical protein